MSNEAAGAAAASGSALKFWGIPVVASAIAIALGFTIMWPETKKEGFQRMVCALISSFFFGPAIVIALHSYWPGIFKSAAEMSLAYSIDPVFGMFFIATPVLVVPALVSWWIFGSFVAWFKKRKDKAADELIIDAIQSIKEVKEAL